MDLEEILEDALRGTYEAARTHGYVATYFLRMLDEYGGVRTAELLLEKNEPQTGLHKLWELGILHESMEAVVLQKRFETLLDRKYRDEARRRLEELGYQKDAEDEA